MSDTERKPILCLDFDGVIHSYRSGWTGADNVADLPVAGSMDFICQALQKFDVQIYSSRSGQEGGIWAMQQWLTHHMQVFLDCDEAVANEIACFKVKWPTEKPPAMVTIDDRAITFTGTWPAIRDLEAFKPWNKE